MCIQMILFQSMCDTLYGIFDNLLFHDHNKFFLVNHGIDKYREQQAHICGLHRKLYIELSMDHIILCRIDGIALTSLKKAQHRKELDKNSHTVLHAQHNNDQIPTCMLVSPY